MPKCFRKPALQRLHVCVRSDHDCSIQLAIHSSCTVMCSFTLMVKLLFNFHGCRARPNALTGAVPTAGALSRLFTQAKLPDV